jgi:uncharacterized damage-inducible protein DinB
MTNEVASKSISPIRRIFRTNEFFYSKSFEGISDADLLRRVAECANPLIWVAGHMADTRFVVLKALGEAAVSPWGDLFGRGSCVGDEYPSIAEILSTMSSVSERMNAALVAVDEERLWGQPSGIGLPNTKTLMDELSFLAWHESYHLGQLAYIRKALGYSRLMS